MKLADYLYRERITPGRFRRMLGVVHCRSTVWRYLRDERIPQPKIMILITRLTGGLVRLEDFLDETPPDCSKRVTAEDGTTKRLLPWSPGYDLLPDPSDDPDTSLCDDGMADLPAPLECAVRVLGSRVVFTRSGTYLLDGQASDPRRVIRAANLLLLKAGQEPIAYPGADRPYG